MAQKLKKKRTKVSPPQQARTGTVWDNKKIVERLVACLDDWTSGQGVADKLSGEFGVKLTRNAIIGKIHRMGLAHRLPVETKAKPKRRGKPFRFERKHKDKIYSSTPVKPEPVIPRSDLPPTVATRTFATLGPDDCKWPVGHPRNPGFGFCGQPRVFMRPYCEVCCQRAYVPVRVKSREDAPERETA